MSTGLTAQVGSDALDDSLTEIDSRGKDLSQFGSSAVGPFGVLRLDPVTAPSAVDIPDLDDVDAAQNVALESQWMSSFDPFMSLDYSLQWADLFELDLDNFTGIGMEGIDQSLLPYDNGTSSLGLRTQTLPYQFNDPKTSPALPSASSDVLTEAQYLLKHFQDHVISSMAALPFGSKSPWKILNLSAAVQTLADLTYLGKDDIKHANLANFFGILACSAYHLATNPSSPSAQSSDRWSDIVKVTSTKAKSHIQKSLHTEFQGNRKAKYKEQLMAILTCTAFAVTSGNQRDARYFTLDAERLLRMRGLAKHDISRKSRMLHHIYTWIRIVGESTYVLHDYNTYVNVADHFQSRTPPRERADSLQNSRQGHNARLDDFLRLEPQGEDVDIELQKEPDIGLIDIHLDDPRQYSATMYLQIYGLSETWLSLVSQTTRLANVTDTWRISGREAPSWLQRSLRKRAERLENMVCSFASNNQDNEDDTPSPTSHMIRALNSALVIFFYRRIRDVNSWILQSHVDNVISALRAFDVALAQQRIPGPGTAWPAFMAGCEALSSSRRDSLLTWTETAFSQSGMYGFKAAGELMQEVWRRRDEAATSPGSTSSNSSAPLKAPWTWVAVSREQNLWAMLC